MAGDTARLAGEAGEAILVVAIDAGTTLGGDGWINEFGELHALVAVVRGSSSGAAGSTQIDIAGLAESTAVKPVAFLAVAVGDFRVVDEEICERAADAGGGRRAQGNSN